MTTELPNIEACVPREPGKSVWIDGDCWYRDWEGMRAVFCRQVPIASYSLDDALAGKMLILQLRLQYGVGQCEVAAAFGVGISTVRLWERQYREGGAAGLVRKERERRGLKVRGAVEEAVRRMVAEGLGDAAIAGRLGLSTGTVWHARRRLGLKRCAPADPTPLLPCVAADTDAAVEAAGPQAPEAAADSEAVAEDVEAHASRAAAGPAEDAVSGIVEAAEAAEPGVAAPAEPLPEGVSADADPFCRSVDRGLAQAGLLHDAAPLFGRCRGLAGGGVLLAMPLIAASGIVETARDVFGSLGPAFYGVRTTVMMLLVMALLRLRRPENLQDVDPARLGRLIGLDRFAEVRTLRRRLSEMAARSLGMRFMTEAARRRCASLAPDLVGWLYVDGHVREYHGKRKLSMTKIPARDHVARAMTDTWVNDGEGGPLFVVPGEMNEALSQTLPRVVKQARELSGRRDLTVLFDRGGWSAELFAALVQDGVHIVTYRRPACEELPPESFILVNVPGRDGEAWRLHDAEVVVSGAMLPGEDGQPGPLRLRQITRLREDGTQTQVVTSRRDLPAAEVLQRLFGRWRQENFFKYMKQEFALDGLAGYDLGEFGADTDCPNPEHKRIGRRIEAVNKKLRRHEAQLGAFTAAAPTPWYRSLAGHKRSHAELVAEIADLNRQREALLRQKAETPARVPARECWERLCPEKKLITDTVKMTAYQVETAMLALLPGDFRKRRDEGRALVAAAMQTPADIEPSATELHVRLHPLANPRRTRALAALCDRLNEADARFPGTDLRLRYAVLDAPSANET